MKILNNTDLKEGIEKLKIEKNSADEKNKSRKNPYFGFEPAEYLNLHMTMSVEDG